MPPLLLRLLLLRSPLPLLRFCSPEDPTPRSLELLPRLSDVLRSENIARSLLEPRSSDEDSRLLTRSLLRPLDSPLEPLPRIFSLELLPRMLSLPLELPRMLSLEPELLPRILSLPLELLRMLSLPVEPLPRILSLPLIRSLLRAVSREPSACSISDERPRPPCLSVRFLSMRDVLLNCTVAKAMPIAARLRGAAVPTSAAEYDRVFT
jgi:hypothetical protein